MKSLFSKLISVFWSIFRNSRDEGTCIPKKTSSVSGLYYIINLVLPYLSFDKAYNK